MNTFDNYIAGFVKVGVLMPLLASAAIADVFPRDLDGDPATVEAYYDDQNNITAIAHPNLALSEMFGIPRTVARECRDGIFCNETQTGIDRFGFMEWPTADAYIASMNAGNYMGRDDWRLPGTSYVWDTQYRWLGDSHELDEILGARYSMYLPVYDFFTYRFVTETYHPDGGRAYIKWGSTYELGIGPGDGLTRFAIWPVLDGDVGAQVITEAQQYCSDFDGDGYGWNGSASCVVKNYSSYTNVIHPLVPRDLDGDPATAEAYYHPQLEMTWLADSRLAQSNPQGLSSEINPDGSFARSFVAVDWIYRLNQADYLGHNQWRLPAAIETYEPGFSTRLYDSEFDTLSQNYVRLTSATGSRFELADGQYFVKGNSIMQSATLMTFENSHYVTVSSVDWRKSYFAWPVHDGDIGTPITLNPVCIDTDGDGWGWTGTASCKL